MTDASPEPGPRGTPGPGQPGQPHAPASLRRQLRALWRELPGLFSDRVELLSLELQRAARSLAEIVALIVGMAILGVTAWLALWAALVGLLVRAGLPLTVALLLAIAVNVGVILLALRRMRRLLPRLSLPATRRHLMVTPDPTPPDDPAPEPFPKASPEDRSDDRPAAPATGQPVAR